MQKLIKIHPDDNVAIALVDLEEGMEIPFEGDTINALSYTKAKHKISLEELPKGGKIVMYGILVGMAKEHIAKGGLLTTTNVAHESSSVKGKTQNMDWTPPDVSKWKDRTFMGYPRKDGQVGTANVWLFFPLVFCENQNILRLKETFEKEFYTQQINEQRLLLRSLIDGTPMDEGSVTQKKPVFENVNVKFITHQGGCGGIRQDAELLAKLLAGYVNNPNVAGATVLSLGCQNLQVELFKKTLATLNPEFDKPILIYEQQQMGTVDHMLNTIIRDSFKAIKEANEIKRIPAPLSKLKLGLECGGSDGFSGNFCQSDFRPCFRYFVRFGGFAHTFRIS